MARVLMAVLLLAACGDDGARSGDADVGCSVQACTRDAAVDAAAPPDAGANVEPLVPDASDASAAGAAGPAGPLGGRLLDVAELAALVDDLRVIDARSGAAFEAAHVPGAVSLPAGSVRAEVDGVPAQVPPADDLVALLGAVGFDPELPVVVYGAESDLDAARVVWTLEYAGHADVRLLDGGFAAWSAAGEATDVGAVDATPTSPSSEDFDLERRVDVDWVLAHLDDASVVLVDARSSAEYGAGHIPGAVSRDWTMNVIDGALRPRAELEALYADVPRDATVVAYCQTGSRASMAYFTLRHLGYPDVRLYDGSMAEWTQDTTRPLEP